jgi:hypothetical protein
MVLPWLAFLAGAVPLGAQDTTRATIDSLAARLERTEEQLRMLRGAMVADAQASVRTRSRLSLELRGRVLVNAFTTSAAGNSTDNPLFVRPPDGSGDPKGLGMVARQTTLGFAVGSPGVFGADFLGDLDVDFHGGQLASSGGRTFPLIRLRTARAVLRWPHAEMLMGQESPLIAGVNPVSLASVATPGFTGAGNLWLWLPQVRLSAEAGGAVRLGAQAAILAPASGAAVAQFDVADFDAAERSSRPFLEGRMRVRWGSDDMTAEIGAGAHQGWFADADSLVSGTVVAVDALVPITRWLDVRGEWHSGRGSRALGGGAIGQLAGPSGQLVHTRAGWGQLNVRVVRGLSLGVGYGVDDPDDDDLAAGGRLENSVAAGRIEWRPAGTLLFGLEGRRITTTYAAGRFRSDHINLAFGFEF